MASSALALPQHSGLVLAPRPFAGEGDVSLHAMPTGLSVAEMIASLEVEGSLDPALRPWLRVVVGGEALPRAFWAHRRPLPDETIVVEVAPMGSNAVRTLMQIAVIALSAFAAASIPGLGGALAAAAISVGGMAAINAIAPIKQPEMAQREQRYSLDGSSNAATPHEAVPIVLGRRRIFPPRCANWFTVTIDNVVYLRQMFQPCVNWVDHETPRIGQGALDSFDGVTVRWATRPDENVSPQWFNRTPAEDPLGLPIKAASGWVTRPAPLQSDALSIDVAFLAGLFESKESSGNPKNRSVTFEFRYGPRDGDPSAATACPFAGGGGQMTFTRDKLTAYRVGWEWAVPRGDYDVHIRRVSAEESNNPRISDELTWVCVRSFRNEPPVRDLATKPWIELELRATDQLNGIPDTFNFIATSIVPRATAEGPAELIATRNPADLYLAASYPPLSDVELDDDERDFSAIAAWRATCVEQDWKCDLAEQGELSVGELLQRTAAAGRARPTLDYGALSVVVDWEKPFPRQMFTPRNVSAFQGDAVIPADVHALRIRFPRADNDYDDDTVTVFAQRPGSLEFYDLDTASIFERIEIRDKTDIDEVEWEGARLLAERVQRPERFTFEQDIEHLTAREGSRAWLAHHAALVGEISGRVAARHVDPADAAHQGLTLDEAVVMVGGRSYDLAWRPSQDAPLQRFALETLPGASDVVWFADPAPATQPAPGDLVAIFEHAVELLDVIVDRIEPKEGLRASITCVPYAEALQHVGEGPIPAYRTNVSRPPALPGTGVIIARPPQAVDKTIDYLGEALNQAGRGLEALKDIVDKGVQEVGGLTPTELVNELRAASEQGRQLTKSTLELAMAAIDERGQLISETFHKGVRVKRILIDEDQAWEEGDKTFWSRMGLMALLSPSGNSMIMRHDTLMWSAGESLAEHVEAIRTQIGTDIASYNTQIRSWVNTSSAGVLWIQQLEVSFGNNFRGSITQTANLVSGMGGTVTNVININGHISGTYNINTGLRSGYVVVASEIGFSNGGSDLLYPLAIVGGIVKATNFEVDRMKANSITAANIIAGNITYLHIANGNVLNNHVGGDEITDAVTSVSGVPVALSIGSWASLRTLSRYSYGGRLEITTQATIGSSGSDSYVSFRVLVDGFETDWWPKYVKGGAYDRMLSSTDATPGAGWHTIEFQAKLEPGSGAANSVNHLIRIIEHKTER